ncbi:hypothetical protein M406DRAFT_341467 [Cryphonectria parasitica EP155]|uniref:Ubiquitin-protein ligase sel1 n=1 Tax=Cryphonectria parasitica (strain ATCC 38755 / EP155) TaxID=660469 RepID=A0A9P5CKF9_CRYP1|nr:uncharacterized protein M406DRAFT_341467 [Cryphonectria parasitica EP155]KAF3762199.1 hypothetical protein M406DRAFT_341467 [Cryphonectria parasitica EP155]
MQVRATDVPEGFVEENGRLVPFWYSRTGLIIKWSVFLGLIVILAVYSTVGYMHAKRRIRKGLPPLAYHRWLISRAELARVDPRYAYPQSSYTTYRPDYQGQYYNMQPNMPPPPPMYDPAGRPPIYDGPVGGTKTAPSQWTQGPTPRPADEEYGSPEGPPPAHTAASPVAPQGTGSSNPYRL